MPVYICKVCWQKCQQYREVVSPFLLALATLGSATQTGTFISICVKLPMVAKASKTQLISVVRQWHNCSHFLQTLLPM
jgi:hypothetical protein